MNNRLLLLLFVMWLVPPIWCGDEIVVGPALNNGDNSNAEMKGSEIVVGPALDNRGNAETMGEKVEIEFNGQEEVIKNGWFQDEYFDECAEDCEDNCGDEDEHRHLDDEGERPPKRMKLDFDLRDIPSFFASFPLLPNELHSCYNYALCDSRFLEVDVCPSLETFIKSIIYFGKSCVKSRPSKHIITARKYLKDPSKKRPRCRKNNKIMSIMSNDEFVIAVRTTPQLLTEGAAFCKESIGIVGVKEMRKAFQDTSKGLTNIINGTCPEYALPFVDKMGREKILDLLLKEYYFNYVNYPVDIHSKDTTTTALASDFFSTDEGCNLQTQRDARLKLMEEIRQKKEEEKIQKHNMAVAQALAKAHAQDLAKAQARAQAQAKAQARAQAQAQARAQANEAKAQEEVRLLKHIELQQEEFVNLEKEAVDKEIIRLQLVQQRKDALKEAVDEEKKRFFTDPVPINPSNGKKLASDEILVVLQFINEKRFPRKSFVMKEESSLNTELNKHIKKGERHYRIISLFDNAKVPKKTIVKTISLYRRAFVLIVFYNGCDFLNHSDCDGSKTGKFSPAGAQLDDQQRVLVYP